tara:strand:- start:303 stop:446 length:144 start_codon:yes stop_codon:yes gene_type:complete
MFKYLIAILILWMIYRFTKKREDKIIINKNTKIDFKKVKDAEFEDNE